MAAIADTQISQLFSEGGGEKTMLFRINNVTTADTYNFSAYFKKVKAAVWAPAGDLVTGVVGSLSGSPATIVTFTLASLAADSIYVLVVGQGA
jgi:hypothetical protein